MVEREGTEGHAERGDGLPPAAKARITDEIQDCQDRTVRVIVPTIVSFGLSAIGNLGVGSEGVGIDILFGALFAVLFSSSLYIASLSYKIFERAAFLRYFSLDGENDWESLIDEYRSSYAPSFIGSETTAIAWIYITLAALYTWVFLGKITTPALLLTSGLLFVVAFRIWLIPRSVTASRLDDRLDTL